MNDKTPTERTAPFSPRKHEPEAEGGASSDMPTLGGLPVILAVRGLVAFELARWPDGDAGELDLAVERLARQGRQLSVSVEALIVELRTLVQRHTGSRQTELERRPLREHLVSVLIEAYYRAD